MPDHQEDEERRRWLRQIAPTRSHGIATGLPREETIRPPNSPGYRPELQLADGTLLRGGDVFTVEVKRRNYMRAHLRFVFRRARIDDNEITAWGPIGSEHDGWRTFDPAEVITHVSAAVA
jgi:hypothetical protein